LICVSLMKMKGVIEMVFLKKSKCKHTKVSGEPLPENWMEELHFKTNDHFYNLTLHTCKECGKRIGGSSSYMAVWQEQIKLVNVFESIRLGWQNNNLTVKDAENRANKALDKYHKHYDKKKVIK